MEPLHAYDQPCMEKIQEGCMTRRNEKHHLRLLSGRLAMMPRSLFWFRHAAPASSSPEITPQPHEVVDMQQKKSDAWEQLEPTIAPQTRFFSQKKFKRTKQWTQGLVAHRYQSISPVVCAATRAESLPGDSLSPKTLSSFCLNPTSPSHLPQQTITRSTHHFSAPQSSSQSPSSSQSSSSPLSSSFFYPPTLPDSQPTIRNAIHQAQFKSERRSSCTAIERVFYCTHLNTENYPEGMFT